MPQPARQRQNLSPPNTATPTSVGAGSHGLFSKAGGEIGAVEEVNHYYSSVPFTSAAESQLSRPGSGIGVGVRGENATTTPSPLSQHGGQSPVPQIPPSNAAVLASQQHLILDTHKIGLLQQRTSDRQQQEHQQFAFPGAAVPMVSPPPPPPRLPPDSVSPSSSEAILPQPLHPPVSQQKKQLAQEPQTVAELPDPGESWLPLSFLEDKSKADLHNILTDASLLSALTYAPQTAHPSLGDMYDRLSAALRINISAATSLEELEAQLASTRAEAQARLLAAHAAERQFKQRQAALTDERVGGALAGFAPQALYRRLVAATQEQEAVSEGILESFMDSRSPHYGGHAVHGQHGEGDRATEREVVEWVRQYREARKLYYLRRERKARWDEGRVGGWR